MKESRTLYTSSFPTPMGRFSLAVGPDGLIAAAAFGGLPALRGRLGACALKPDARRTAEARRQVGAWLQGRRHDFSLGLSPAGTPFQRRVWAALGAIPYGQTRSYGELARSLGSSARAVGRASATNPICVIVPCHRVIGSDGSLTGYAFGEGRKRRLLDLEGA